jgi:hypothetical protein
VADRDPERLKNYVEMLKAAHGGIGPLMEIAVTPRGPKAVWKAWKLVLPRPPGSNRLRPGASCRRDSTTALKR